MRGKGRGEVEIISTIIFKGEPRAEKAIIQPSGVLGTRKRIQVEDILPANTKAGWCSLPREENQSFVLERSSLLEGLLVWSGCGLSLIFTCGRLVQWHVDSSHVLGVVGFSPYPFQPHCIVASPCALVIRGSHPNQNNNPLLCFFPSYNGQHTVARGQNLACHLFLEIKRH